MNGTVYAAELLLGMFDARQSETHFEKQIRDVIERVSNNLGVYFLFVWFSYSCSFSLEFYASSANKPVFLCFTSPSLAGFYVSINFYRRGTLDFK